MTNVIDIYKYLDPEEIKNSVQNTSFNYYSCMDHLEYDFNISQVLRNSNAFGAKGMFYIGNKRWDKRGAVGTYNYTDVEYFADVSSFLDYSRQNNLMLISVEQSPFSIDLYSFQIDYVRDLTPCFIFGNESRGIHPDLLHESAYILEIPQYGSVRSINAAASSAVALSYFAHQQTEINSSK